MQFEATIKHGRDDGEGLGRTETILWALKTQMCRSLEVGGLAATGKRQAPLLIPATQRLYSRSTVLALGAINSSLD